MPHVDFPQSSLRCGIARRDITPPPGIYHRMWGAATHDRATGVHRPLVATAMAIAPLPEPSSTSASLRPQVLITLDHCLFWNDEMAALRSAVCRDVPLDEDQLQIAFSHTHAAGLMDPKRHDLPGGDLVAPYLAALEQCVVAAAQESLRNLQPAHIVYGLGCCDLAQNRDLWDGPRQQFVCGFNPTGPHDNSVLVARITGSENRTIATLVNYACHPTTLAWDNTLVSPDYVGAMREQIEAVSGAPCIFVQGASGDLGPREGFVGDVAVADRNGRALGYAALAALELMPPPLVRFEYIGAVISGATIGTWDYRALTADQILETEHWQTRRLAIELAIRTDLESSEITAAHLTRWQHDESAATDAGDHARARDCRAQIERMTRQLSRLAALPPGDRVTLHATLWQLGTALWLFVEGEHYQLLQRELRARFSDCPIVVATMTNGWNPGYLPPAEIYGTGIYQETVAVVAAGSLEKVIQRIGDEIEHMREG
ncbi:MAG TPA: hypothetical protein VHV08_01865 [Pirellulales bacterium]|nr:hypothetical protein [Pirellulales bacterium]